ncbi:glutamate racemase [Algibacillus agarilyticus]|uniref:glutamate racemase n=1 Tax=Algibacillus agarilyticus TaxID=2234133 RepID=UPI000DD0164A|nr:glutamate racemase [Algibacillus agarilyticus]
MSAYPIGVFDSGVGGLSLLSEINRLLPNESCIYIADSLYAPYGEKSADMLWQRCCAISEFLIEQGVKIIVVACNTATVAVIKQLRVKYRIPFIGIEPAVKPALLGEFKANVAILATQNTINSQRLSLLINTYKSPSTTLYPIACLGWVEMIELGISHEQIKQKISETLTDLIKLKPSIIVLACTHYPFISALITECFDYPVQIIEPGAAVAQQVKNVLHSLSILSLQADFTHPLFYCSGDTHIAEQRISHLINKQVNVRPFTV